MIPLMQSIGSCSQWLPPHRVAVADPLGVHRCPAFDAMHILSPSGIWMQLRGAYKNYVENTSSIINHNELPDFISGFKTQSLSNSYTIKWTALPPRSPSSSIGAGRGRRTYVKGSGLKYVSRESNVVNKKNMSNFLNPSLPRICLIIQHNSI